MPIMVLMFQAIIVATIFAARLHSKRASIIAALCWSTTAIILIFMPWLMMLQLAVIWSSQVIFASKDSLELPEGDPARTYAILAAGCLIASPLLLPLLGVAGVAGWAAWRRFSDEDRFIGPIIPLAQVTQDTPRWRSHYVRACESPAESAFLKAMVSRYAMTPDAGTLRSPGIGLEMQKPIGRYRADFVANERLVIEIDGAAYHGSPEAQARDRQRDLDMHAMGYVVLRIPAKMVFRTPGQAIRMVEKAAIRLQ